MPAGSRAHGWLDRHWRPAIICALLLLAVAGGYAIRSSERSALDALHRTQLTACVRGNVLRAEIQVNVGVLDALLTEAIRVRTVQARVAPTGLERTTSANAAARYEHLRDLTTAVPQVDCAAVIPRP